MENLAFFFNGILYPSKFFWPFLKKESSGGKSGIIFDTWFS